MWFAWLMQWASRFHEPMVAERKRALFAGLTGRVLEIGAGNGVNLRYLPAGVQWTGYEPNRYLAARIEVPEGGELIVDSYRGQAGEFDAVICSLVLCSVKDPAEVLAGLYRCLKPGGRFLFVEHVAAEPGSRLRAAQEKWLPLWRCCAGGCHPNRETAALIAAAGFDMKWSEQFDLPLGLAGPHLIGEALRG